MDVRGKQRGGLERAKKKRIKSHVLLKKLIFFKDIVAWQSMAYFPYSFNL